MMDASVVVAPQDVDAGGSGRQYGKNKDVTFGPAVDAVMEQIRHRFTIASVRSLFTCVGLGEAEPFTMPSQSQMLPRLKANGNFYLTNYLLVAAFVFFFILLFFHPIQLVICMVVAWGWYIVLTKKDSELEHVRICGRRVGEQEILLVTTGSSIVFLVFYILPEMLVAIAVSSVGCSIHALLRNNRLKDDDAYSVLPQKEVSSSSAESPEEPV
ncbi:hypothetical protein Poli38472_005554 [Pythium oligandrum]|uniref:PRA1 family protein n=1 Tax=Pythium oligandrum TaxID=41045 RepID=A0A8K1CHL2_PYTOL|nr:hypothetical protein Poli38472_005554 [Pythium oligandrum]|eukprot:TMW62936.1 hypothetical protein Poli38472_005554 [Pythium oligandrum]